MSTTATITKSTTFPYKKTMEDSLKDGLIISGVTIASFMILKYLLKTSPPAAKLDASDALKLTGGIVTGVFFKDYLKYEIYFRIILKIKWGE